MRNCKRKVMHVNSVVCCNIIQYLSTILRSNSLESTRSSLSLCLCLSMCANVHHALNKFSTDLEHTHTHTYFDDEPQKPKQILCLMYNNISIYFSSLFHSHEFKFVFVLVISSFSFSFRFSFYSLWLLLPRFIFLFYILQTVCTKNPKT